MLLLLFLSYCLQNGTASHKKKKPNPYVLNLKCGFLVDSLNYQDFTSYLHIPLSYIHLILESIYKECYYCKNVAINY